MHGTLILKKGDYEKMVRRFRCVTDFMRLWNPIVNKAGDDSIMAWYVSTWHCKDLPKFVID